MPARKVKTLFKNPNERNHREHRSKRGRSPEYAFRTRTPYKRGWHLEERSRTIKRMEEIEPRKVVAHTLNCVEYDCGREFTITVGESEFYEKKGLVLPKRCKKCRNKKREYGNRNEEDA